jgi:tRNA G18 (ribose-2'-O)-methylase SpoU
MKKLKLEELGRLSAEEFKAKEKLPLRIVLDNIRSLHNVGSIFRTADAFSVEKIYLTGITGTPPHREIEKSALGATNTVAWEHAEDPSAVVKKLRQEGWKIVIVEQTTASIPLHSLQPQGRICLVLGNEIDGVSEPVIEHADMAVEIPQSGTKHSLNVSVCAGIVVWSFFQKIKI